MSAVLPILEVSRLSVHFGQRAVLTDLSFRVPRGTSLAIIGPNGAGKTVLVRALIGAVPFQGVVRWAPGSRIGYVPQRLDLERDVPVTGLDFLRARAALSHAPDTSILRTLRLVGVPEDVAARTIGAMSGGQFQRLLVAFALVGAPNVLLLDEPTAGVDLPGQAQLYDLVERLQRDLGLTTIFVSHDLSVVYHYATSVLCLNQEIACMGPPATILTPDRLRAIYGVPLGYHVHDPAAGASATPAAAAYDR